MNNLEKLPSDIQKAVTEKTWICDCGQEGLRFSVTTTGKVQARCFTCGMTIFFNDPQLFTFEGGPWFFQKETPITKKLRNGGTTSWYPRHRVRIFRPK